jgi:D-hydroxyproline dehydrogenase subunit beta
MTYDVVIMGAGIIGCACARECASAGLRVAIVERDVPGGDTTAAGMGHVVVMDDTPAQLALTRYSRALWHELRPELPPSVEYEPCGTLWVADCEEDLNKLDAKRATYVNVNVRAEVLTGAQVLEAEPNLRSGLCGGLLVPDDAVVYPPAAASFFLGEAEKYGATLLLGRSIVRASQGAVHLEDGTVLSCGSIVAAIGADTALLPWLPIQKRKGHLLITDRYPEFVHHQLIEIGYLKSAHAETANSVAFNVQPRQTGQLLIGSSRQFGCDDLAVDQGILHEMLERACSYMPPLKHVSSIRVWTGFRAATPDNLPLIGPTDDSTLFLAAGFEGLGITNALGAARLLADHIAQRDSAISPDPYLPGRASLREAFYA